MKKQNTGNRMKDGIQRRGKSFRIAVWFTDQVTGKKKLHTETFHDEESAKLRKLEIESEKIDEQFMPSKRMTTAEFLDEWLRTECRKKSPRTYQGYESIVRVHLKPLFGSVQVTKIHPFLIERQYATLLEQGSRKDGKKGAHSGLTVRNIHRCLSKACADGVRWKILKVSPCDGVTLPEVESDEMVVMNDAQALAVIDSAANTALPLPIMIGYYGGLRRGEILGLRASDLEVDPDWTVGALWIRRSISEIDGKRIPADVIARYGESIVRLPDSTRLLRIKQTKGKRIRIVPLPTEILARIREHLVEQSKVRQLLTGSPLDSDGWLFPRPDGSAELWAPSAFTSCFRAFLKRRGLKPAKFHGLRHAYGSGMLKDGVDLRTVSSLMGHARTSTTANVYLHLLEQPGQEIAQRIQARIDRTKRANPAAQSVN